MNASNSWYFCDMPQSPPAIPTYGLFGESAQANTSGFAHIETIAARSLLHNWEITPHRHQHGAQVLIIHAGHAQVTLDGQRFGLGPPGFVVLPAGSVHGFAFDAGTQGHVLTVSVDFMGRANSREDELRRLLTLGGHGALAPAAARRVALLAGEMLALAQEWQASGALFQALAEALLRSLPGPAPAAPLADGRLALFRHLVEVHLREHRSLEFYAASLGCTPRTLGRLCRAGTGLSPLELINQRLALEAERLLRYTSANVTQVADALGFADPSYFSRFYLRMTGQRPKKALD